VRLRRSTSTGLDSCRLRRRAKPGCGPGAHPRPRARAPVRHWRPAVAPSERSKIRCGLPGAVTVGMLMAVFATGSNRPGGGHLRLASGARRAAAAGTDPAGESQRATPLGADATEHVAVGGSGVRANSPGVAVPGEPLLAGSVRGAAQRRPSTPRSWPWTLRRAGPVASGQPHGGPVIRVDRQRQQGDGARQQRRRDARPRPRVTATPMTVNAGACRCVPPPPQPGTIRYRISNRERRPGSVRLGGRIASRLDGAVRLPDVVLMEQSAYEQ
jgi:hypothetical protein